MAKPITQHPDFEVSLRLLIERERYSLTDIGLMFGRSRERVRQWCDTRSIIHPDQNIVGMKAYRIWDDRLNHFIPVSRGALTQERKTQEGFVRKQGRVARCEDRLRLNRTLIINTAVELKHSLGRDPYLGEVYEAVTGIKVQTGASARLVGLWDTRRRSTKTKNQEMREALRDAGVSVQKSGGWRGNFNRKKRERCKRGHLLESSRNKRGKCRVCEKWRSLASYCKKVGKSIPSEPFEYGFEPNK